MKLILKAYKCIFPSLHSDFYKSNKWEDSKQYELIYGLSQKQAVNNRCNFDEFSTFFELKQDIKTKRFKEMDLFKVDECYKIKNLQTKYKHHLLHSLGVGFNQNCPNEFYRNYSMYREPHEDCEVLVKMGLMNFCYTMGSHVYSVTDEGVKSVKTLLLLTKKQIDEIN